MKALVIVDGYSSGRLLVDSFNRKFKDHPDMVAVHVLSTPTPYTSMAAPETHKYAESIVFNGNLDDVLLALKKYDVVAVFPGQEPGVELADRLSEKLGLATTNGTKLSTARRNKFDMVKAVAEAKINAPKFIKTKDYAEILSWVKLNTEYPVVIKALRSAGTDGVYICANEKELKANYDKLFGSESIYNEINNEILVESFLDGNEYVVNGVSLLGKHHVTDVWMYQKKLIPGHGYVYDKEKLLSTDLPEVRALIQYNAEMLDALNILNGPSHAEIMFTSKGPALVEVGARITGHAHPKMHDLCLGHNQVDLTIDCYTNPEVFAKTVSEFPYKLKQHAMVVNLVYEGLPGKVELIDKDVLAQIESLKSVHQFVMRTQEGASLTPTRTLVNSPARIFMTHASEKQLDADYDEIQRLKHRLFRVAVDPVHRVSTVIDTRPKLELKGEKTAEKEDKVVAKLTT